jgi:hypothetical protein
MNSGYQLTEAQKKGIQACAKDANLYIKHILHQELEDYAIKVIEAFDIYQRVAVRACHMVGKTHLIGCLGVTYMIPDSKNKVVVTAPTFDQIRRNVFGELHKQYGNLPPMARFGDLNQTEWNIDAETWIVGKSVQKTASGKGGGEQQSSRLQGIHSEGRVIVIIDEAVGVEEQIFTQVEGIASGDEDKVLLIYNPTSKNCSAYRKANSDEFIEIVITCFDTPNFKHHEINDLHDLQEIYKEWQAIPTKEGKLLFLENFNSIKSYCISVKWVLNRLKEWGVDHPLFRSKCLGLWPLEDMYTLIPLSVVEQCIEREYEIQANDETYIGVDVAGDGSDSTVFLTLDGYKQTDYESHGQTDAVEVCEYLINYLRRGQRYGKSKIRIIVDAGFSFGVIANMKRWLLPAHSPDKMSIPKVADSTDWERKNIEFLEFGFGWSKWTRWHFGWVDEAEYTYKSIEEHRIVEEDQSRYLNYKAKGFDSLATDCRNSLDLFDSECYKKELPFIMLQSSGQAGKMKIQSKIEFKADNPGIGSPDSADALMLANVGRTYNKQPISPFSYYEK